MKFNRILLLIAMFLFHFVNAQQNDEAKGSDLCSKRKQLNTHLVEKSFRSVMATKHSFDVLKYTMNIDLVNCFTSPYPKSFKADVTLSFRVDSTLNTITLNAVNTSLTIDSIRLNAASFVHSANMLTIQLDHTYDPGEEANVRIYYHHKDVSDGAFYASGGFVFTDCEPEGARYWFPCYDKPSDKALTDITALVPSTVLLGSNGGLKDSLLDGSTLKYHWVSRDPVATYLMVLTARTNYKLDIVNWTNPNTSEVVPMRFYYNPGENPTAMKNIIVPLTTYFSEKYGDHPFEKNGFATLNNQFVWGGMENQTLTSLCSNCWSESLIVHEYAHQWFGDMLTCNTWADIWLNEGFATWSEAFWYERTGGYTAYKNDIINNATNYKNSNPGWAISVPSWAITTPGVNTLFNTAITYNKASCVLHMLRYVLGDSIFFPALKAYAADTRYKYNSATTEDFKNKMEEISGQDLDWFFDQWIYKPNHPAYKNTYNFIHENDNSWTVNFIVNQQNAQSAPYWQMPIQVKIGFKSGGDTLVKIFNSFGGQSYVFKLNKEPLSVTFDPNNEIVLKTASTVVGLEDHNAEIKQTLKIIPNPVKNSSRISFSLQRPDYVNILLYDNQGKRIESVHEGYMHAGENEFKWNTDNLKDGIYFLALHTGGKTQTLKILIHK